MVFLDDNPVERAIVRENIPAICVPELPEDPGDYLEYLYELNLFETASYSSGDKDRTKQYQTEAKRVQSAQKFTNEADFLKSLERSVASQEQLLRESQQQAEKEVFAPAVQERQEAAGNLPDILKRYDTAGQTK